MITIIIIIVIFVIHEKLRQDRFNWMGLKWKLLLNLLVPVRCIICHALNPRGSCVRSYVFICFLIDSLKQRASLFRLLTAKLRRTPTTHLTWINSVLNTSSTRFTGFRHRSAAHCPKGFQASLHHTPAVATTVSVLGFHKPTPSHIKDLSRWCPVIWSRKLTSILIPIGWDHQAVMGIAIGRIFIRMHRRWDSNRENPAAHLVVPRVAPSVIDSVRC